MPKNTKAGGPSYEPGFADEATLAELPQGKSERALQVEGARPGALPDGDDTERVDEGDGVERTQVDTLDDDAFDPGDYTINEVNTYLDQCRDEGNQAELDRVIGEERAGKARARILNRAN